MEAVRGDAWAEPTPWPLNPLDAALVAQTYEGRPMTTHHVLELDAPVEVDRVRAAAWALVHAYPELASRVELGATPRRWCVPAQVSDVHRRVVADDDPSHAAVERWIQRPIDPTRCYPFSIRLAPGRTAARSLTLSLHHSVADGYGALRMFDRLLGLVAGRSLPPRRAPGPVVLPDEIWGGLRDALRGVAHVLQSAFDLSGASLPDATGHHVTLGTLDAATWCALGRRARADAVSRNTLLWHAAARAVDGLRDDAPRGRDIRILGPVDLRAELGVPDDALQNWLGTMALPVDPDGDVRALHAQLRRARRLPNALATTRMVGAVGKLPWGLAERIFRRADANDWLAPYTMMMSLLRPRGACWPAALRPRSLWCTSLLPRKPGLGLTVTEVDDHVTLAASSHAGALERTVVERFVARLGEVVGELAHGRRDVSSTMRGRRPARARRRAS